MIQAEEMTLVALWTRTRRALEAAGVETPVLDARLLVEAGAGVSRLEIVTEPRRVISPEQAAAVDALVARRAAREPLAYIVGCKAFWKHEFAVTKDTLVPRPETELLVELALQMLGPAQPARVLDLGVGSGAILLSVLSERPLARGVAVDKSAAALSVARKNAAALGLADRVELREGCWAEGIEGAFDLIVSNPPYLAEADMAELAFELAYEPPQALSGGRDGLDAYRAIFADFPRLLTAEGAFAVEVGRGQAEAVVSLAESAGLRPAPPRRDYAGIPRVVFGRGST